MKHKKEFSVLDFIQSNIASIGVVVLVILGLSMYGTKFFNYKRNFINVLHYCSLLGIMGVGVNLSHIIGGRDLSVGAVAACASMFCSLGAPYGFIPALVFGLSVGVIFGLFNGIVISKFQVQPFIATLGTQLIARGIALLINDEYSISLPATAKALKFMGNGRLFGLIPMPTAIFLVLVIVFTIIMKYTSLGRAIYAVGGNAEAAEMMGIRVSNIRIITYIMSGTLAALAGCTLCGHINAGQPTACQGWEMTIMAAVIIGGTPVKGGKGRIAGILYGVIFVQLISNIINLNGKINANWKDVLTGLILLAAVLLYAFADIRKEKKKNIRVLEAVAGIAE